MGDEGVERNVLDSGVIFYQIVENSESRGEGCD
jgi:hypothetical protein